MRLTSSFGRVVVGRFRIALVREPGVKLAERPQVEDPIRALGGLKREREQVSFEAHAQLAGALSLPNSPGSGLKPR